MPKWDRLTTEARTECPLSQIVKRFAENEKQPFLSQKVFIWQNTFFEKNVIYVHNRLFVSILNELVKVKKIFILISTMVNAGSSNL